MPNVTGISSLQGIESMKGFGYRHECGIFSLNGNDASLIYKPAFPTFIQYNEVTSGVGSATTPRSTIVFGVKAGDVLTAFGTIEGQGIVGNDTLAIAGGGLVWTPQQYINLIDYCVTYIWTATATKDDNFSVSFTHAGNTSLWFGGGIYQFRDSGGIGTSNSTNVLSGTPTLSLTTVGNNSAVMVIIGDWSAQDGTTRTWNTINGITPTIGNGLEKVYFRNASHYAVYSAYWNNVGAAGVKSIGLQLPGSQKYAIAAVEIKLS